jgi:hypothetical protein
MHRFIMSTGQEKSLLLRLADCQQSRSRKWVSGKMKGSNPLLEKKVTRWDLCDETIVSAEDFFASHPGFADHASKGTALVGGALVAEKHGAGLNDPFGGVVKDTDIGVKARDEVALLVLQADLRRSVGTAQSHNILKGTLRVGVIGGGSQVLATAELGPHDRESKTDG